MHPGRVKRLRQAVERSTAKQALDQAAWDLGHLSLGGRPRGSRFCLRGDAFGSKHDDAMMMTETHASGFRAHFHPPFKP